MHFILAFNDNEFYVIWVIWVAEFFSAETQTAAWRIAVTSNYQKVGAESKPVLSLDSAPMFILLNSAS